MTTTQPFDPKQEIDSWARELNSRLIMFHHAIGERMGLSATEHKAADILRRFGPMTAGELADLTGLTTGAVTGLVDRLERNNYVKREHDKSDRRRVIIKPITRGRYEEVQDLFEPVKDQLAELLSTYDAKEAAAIADFAAKATDLLSEETKRLRQAARRPHRAA